jgi:hypothetical protein
MQPAEQPKKPQDQAAANNSPTPWSLIVWPAFLAACVLELLVFSLVDPHEVVWFGHALQPSRQAAYTVAFFAFWLVCMGCSALVLWLAGPYTRKTVITFSEQSVK